MPSHRQSVTVVIPARLSSSRFPGKPLAMLAGKPLIRQVYEHVAYSAGVNHVLVATDDIGIHNTVKAFGGAAMMVEGPFRCGTDRVAAVARQIPGQFFLNLQGDEVVLDPHLITDLIDVFLDSGAGIGTLKRRLISMNDYMNPDVVKVITDQSGKALYFSRAPIPHHRDQQHVVGHWYMHLGIYLYTRQMLLHFSELPTGQLEVVEKLEQLRALEHGVPIQVWETAHPSLRIDTSDDLEEAAAVLRGIETKS